MDSGGRVLPLACLNAPGSLFQQQEPHLLPNAGDKPRRPLVQHAVTVRNSARMIQLLHLVPSAVSGFLLAGSKASFHFRQPSDLKKSISQDASERS